jgi:hypothetical protein
MASTILCIASPTDSATSIGAYWMQKYADYALSKGHQVIYQKTPTLPVLYEALLNFNPQLVVANGHGGFKSLRVGENILIGTPGYDTATHRNIKEGDEDYFTGRITLLLTCNAGTELVKALAEHGATAVMGYRKPYVFLVDEDKQPQDDDVSKPFFEALFQPAIQLADGATFKQSIEATRASFKYYLNRTQDKDSRKFLDFNLENLIALGNPDAKLT